MIASNKAEACRTSRNLIIKTELWMIAYYYFHFVKTHNFLKVVKKSQVTYIHEVNNHKKIFYNSNTNIQRHLFLITITSVAHKYSK
jgi:hypothetical protein